LGDLSVNRRILLKWILYELVKEVETEKKRLRLGFSGEVFWRNGYTTWGLGNEISGCHGLRTCVVHWIQTGSGENLVGAFQKPWIP
jgi:hypothetical protein